MRLSVCEYCHGTFWNPGSESVYCCTEHRKLGRSIKMSEIGKRFDTQHARNCRTEDTFQKQQLTMLRKCGFGRPGPAKGWFDNLKPDMRDLLKARMRENHSKAPHPNEGGSIFKHGKRFHAKVELFFYEYMLNKDIFVERSYPVDGWTVDFFIPSYQKMLEIKSWYTVERIQELDVIVSRIRDDILLVEEEDIYKLATTKMDTLQYLEQKSTEFKDQLIEMCPNTVQ